VLLLELLLVWDHANFIIFVLLLSIVLFRFLRR